LSVAAALADLVRSMELAAVVAAVIFTKPVPI